MRESVAEKAAEKSVTLNVVLVCRGPVSVLFSVVEDHTHYVPGRNADLVR